jgi:hypothetical protein
MPTSPSDNVNAATNSTAVAASACDPLTLAYVALGAGRALDARKRTGCQTAAGELDFISDVITHAPLLDAMAADRDFHAVFVYEVAEPFGEQLADHLLDGNEATAEFVNTLATTLISAASDL